MLCCWIFPGHSPASSQLREFLSCAVGLDNFELWSSVGRS